MRYVDGFVVPVPKRKLAAYRNLARKAGKIWMEHGALEYVECSGDDLKSGKLVAFPRLAKLKPGETVFFSYIVYPSKAARDRVNKKVMSDPRLKASMTMPFDFRRMAYGGFKAIVDLRKG